MNGKLRTMSFLDYSGGCGLGSSPCCNCESVPRNGDDLFCSDECRHEYEGCPSGVPLCDECKE
jgi:hypothetical protein